MKRIYLILLLLLPTLAGSAQSGSALANRATSYLYEALSQVHGVQTTYITQAMFDLISDMPVEGLNIKPFVKKIDCLQVVSAEKSDVAEPVFRKATEHVRIGSDYQLLIETKEKFTHTSLYMKTENKKRTFVLIDKGLTDVSVIILTGTLTLADVREIVPKL